MRKLRLLAMLMVSVMVIASFGVLNVSVSATGSNVITQFGNASEISGLTYCDTEGYNSKGSVRFTLSAENNTGDGTNLALAANLGLEVGKKYSYSFYFKPVALTKLWIRMNGTTNNGGGAVAFSDGVLSATQGSSCTKVAPAGNGWYRVYSPTANEHKINWNNMPFFLVTGGGDVDLYIDNFSILDDNGNEMVTNGGFEGTAVDVTRGNNAVTEFGNISEISGLTYSDAVGYNSTGSVYYKKAAADNTANVNLAIPQNLGLATGTKYKISYYIKPVAMSTKLWARINGGVTNAGAAAVYFDENGGLTTNGASFLSIAAAGNGWYRIETSYNEHQIGWSGMPIILAESGGDLEFYMDNFSILDEEGKEMITNGGFDYVAPTPDAGRDDNIITELGNIAEINGLKYSDSVGYNSTSSVRYTKTAAENTGNVGIAMPQNLGMIAGEKYSFSFYIKPIAMTNLWIRVNGTPNGGAGAIKLNAQGSLCTTNAASFISVTSAGNGWYKVASNTSAEHKIAWSGMELLLATSGGNIDFYLDEFSLTNEAGDEMIKNGGFEYQEPEEEEPDKEQVVKRFDNIITEFGNTSEIDGLVYSDTVGYNSTSSIYYKKAAADNTADVNLAIPQNLGLVEGNKYKISFYIKPVAMSAKLWTRINGGVTNAGTAAVYFDEKGGLTTNGASFLSITSAGDGWYKVTTSYNEHKIGWSGMPTIMAGKDGDLEFYMDNFSITTEAGKELVDNMGFELPASQVGEFVLTSNEDGTKTVTVTVANRAEGDDYTAVLILATFNGVIMKKIAHADAETSVAEGTIEKLTETIALSEGESLRAFVWDSVSGMTPLTFARELVSAD